MRFVVVFVLLWFAVAGSAEERSEAGETLKREITVGWVPGGAAAPEWFVATMPSRLLGDNNMAGCTFEIALPGQPIRKIEAKPDLTPSAPEQVFRARSNLEPGLNFRVRAHIRAPVDRIQFVSDWVEFSGRPQGMADRMRHLAAEIRTFRTSGAGSRGVAEDLLTRAKVLERSLYDMGPEKRSTDSYAAHSILRMETIYLEDLLR